MKILLLGIGKHVGRKYLPQSWPDAYVGRHLGEHEILTFGYSEGVDILCRPEDEFERVLERLPPGWTPDYCILMHADWLLLPPGIERAPFPLVYVTADWDYRIAVARTCAEATDLTVVIGEDSRACMEAVGAPRVAVYHYFGTLAEHFTSAPKRIKDRTYDIVFSGTLNDVNHLDRSEWILRLSALSDRYRVCVTPGGESLKEYLDLLGDAKLTFTSNRRGEVQLRFADAASQGTVTLDPGVEIGKYFAPGEEYVPVTQENIAEQVARCLSDTDRLQAVADRVRDKVRGRFESRTLFQGLIACIDQNLKGRRADRAFCRLPAHEQLLRRGEICYFAYFSGFNNKHRKLLQLSIDAFSKAIALEASPRAIANLAVATASLGFSYGEGAEREQAVGRAVFLLEEAAAAYPSYGVAHFLLGILRLISGRQDLAQASFLRALEVCSGSEGEVDPWCLYPLEIDRDHQLFSLGHPLNLLLLSLRKSEPEAQDRIQDLYLAAIHYYLAVIEEKQGLPRSLDSLRMSHALFPRSGIVLKTAAAVASVLGFREEGLRYYKQALALLPMDLDLRFDYIKRLYLAGEIRETFEEIRVVLGLLRTVKTLRPRTLTFQALLDSMGRRVNPSAAYSHDSCREQLFHADVEVLFAWLRKNPSEFQLVSRIAEIWEGLGRTNRSVALLEEYLEAHGGIPHAQTEQARDLLLRYTLAPLQSEGGVGEVADCGVAGRPGDGR